MKNTLIFLQNYIEENNKCESYMDIQNQMIKWILLNLIHIYFKDRFVADTDMEENLICFPYLFTVRV